MKLSEMAMATGDVSGMGFTIIPDKKDGKGPKDKDGEDKDGNEEEEEVCDSGEHTGTGSVKEGIYIGNRETQKDRS